MRFLRSSISIDDIDLCEMVKAISVINKIGRVIFEI